eukprot:6040739-Amphidinium_carterae.1
MKWPTETLGVWPTTVASSSPLCAKDWLALSSKSTSAYVFARKSRDMRSDCSTAVLVDCAMSSCPMKSV